MKINEVVERLLKTEIVAFTKVSTIGFARKKHPKQGLCLLQFEEGEKRIILLNLESGIYPFENFQPDPSAFTEDYEQIPDEVWKKWISKMASFFLKHTEIVK